MKSPRTRRHALQNIRPMALAILVIILGMITLYIPPANSIIISIYILLVALVGYIVSSYIVPFPLQVLGVCGLLVFLIMNLLVGFSLLNTVLLVALLVAVSWLIKK